MSFAVADWLPYATPIDPSDEPPSSIDPLGLTTPAEYLADLLVPGFTVRTWRARLLTFDAVAVHIASAVAKLMDNRDDERTRARLAFERLYVSAVARAENGKGRQPFSRTLPGIELARTALKASENLTKNNFLKGQAVNGPIGVTSRLAKNTGIVTDDLKLGPAGRELITAWSADENLFGITEPESKTPGSQWMKAMIKLVADNVHRNVWPRDGAPIWNEIFKRLRLDQIGNLERKVLNDLISNHAARGRLFSLLTTPEIKILESVPGERSILIGGVKQALNASSAVDARIRAVIDAIDAFEDAAALMQQGFDTLLWGLRRGSSSLEALLRLPQVKSHLDATVGTMPAARKHLADATQALSRSDTPTGRATDSLYEICNDMDRCAESPHMLAEGLLQRHKRVQKIKRKSVWIDGDRILTLCHQMGVDGHKPPTHTGTYLHPFRIRNCASVLTDLSPLGSAATA